MVIFTEAAQKRLRTRYLIVVRRSDESTFEYLKERLATVQDVEVTLDRRAADAPTRPDDRRLTSPRFNALGIMLVRRPVPVP